jgi:hypothetical protein
MHARLALLVLALLGVVAGGAAAADKHTKLAKLLAERDPGARVGGNTIIGTGNSEDLYAVPDRPNFIVALGDGETIHGAGEGDQLGALGTHVTIIAPNAGHALLEGGPQGTIVVGGKGHDLVVEHKAGATVKIDSPGNEVVANGPHDRVVCGAHVEDEVIHLGKTDTASKSCRGHGDEIDHRSSSHSAAAHVAARVITGSGTNADPYVASDCSFVLPGGVCEFVFPQRTLTGYWANEYVPAYKCNSTYPFLHFHAYATELVPHGVNTNGPIDSNIGVNISGIYSTASGYAGGTLTGFPHSSATNWGLGASSYWVELYCTSDSGASYVAGGGSTTG